MKSTSNRHTATAIRTGKATTRVITGKGKVSPFKIANRNEKAGTGTLKVDGLQYDAIRINGSWYLTGDYSY